MKRTFKDDTKFHNMSNSALSKELGISDDRVSSMNSNIETVPIGRVVEAYDSMGGDPNEMISSLSNNSFAHDGLALPDSQLRATREHIADIIKDANLSSAGCRQVKKAVDISYKNVVVYVTGEFGCGKVTMVENLLDTKFRLLGSPLTRSFSHLLIMSDSNSGIDFNYPLGEYLYKISSVELIPELMVRGKLENTDTVGLTPVAKEGISFPNDYVVYSDSPALGSINLICSNQINARLSDTDEIAAAETEAQIVSLSDVVIIMLGADANLQTKLMQPLRCSWERWGYDMMDHVVFVIAKSDRYHPDEVDEIRQAYSEGLRSLMAQIIERQDDRADKLLDDIQQMIFPYSSIYKNENTKGKNDAGFNWPFYKRLQDILAASCNDTKRRKILLRMLFDLEQIVSPEKPVSHNDASKMSSEIRRITAEAENDFKRAFSDSYDGFMDIANISGIISANNIARKQEDRQKLVSIVDSQLTNMARAAAAAAAGKMTDALGTVVKDLSCGKAGENIIERVQFICKSLNEPSADYSLAEGDMDNSGVLSEDGRKNAFVPAGLALGSTIAGVLFPISGIAAGITAAAGTIVTSYYAQTNFEKNMAKKIVSSYNVQGVKEKFMEKIISKYFRPLRDELVAMVGGAELQGDEKAAGLIDRIIAEITG